MNAVLKISSIAVSTVLFSCSNPAEDTTKESKEDKSLTEFSYVADRFADIQVLRYKIEGFEKLSLQQKKLVYYLTQAGMAGRDMHWDQNFKYNLEIRSALENIYTNYQGDKNNENWKKFAVYTKRVWFSSGIHHHYGMNKIMPGFDQNYFDELLKATSSSISPEAKEAIFSTEKYMSRKIKDPNVDMIVASCNNFYGAGVTQKMVEDFYAKLINPNDTTSIEYGLNSTMVIENGQLKEDVWKVGGRYGKVIEKIVFWLNKAVEVAENPKQKKALELLIQYYQTGDLKT